MLALLWLTRDCASPHWVKWIHCCSLHRQLYDICHTHSSKKSLQKAGEKYWYMSRIYNVITWYPERLIYRERLIPCITDKRYSSIFHKGKSAHKGRVKCYATFVSAGCLPVSRCVTSHDPHIVSQQCCTLPGYIAPPHRGIHLADRLTRYEFYRQYIETVSCYTFLLICTLFQSGSEPLQGVKIRHRHSLFS